MGLGMCQYELTYLALILLDLYTPSFSYLSNIYINSVFKYLNPLRFLITHQDKSVLSWFTHSHLHILSPFRQKSECASISSFKQS